MEKGRRSEGSACPCEGGLPQTQDEGTAAGQATPKATDGKQCRVFRPFKSRHQSASKKDGTSLLSHQENTRMSFWSSPPPQHGSSSQFDKGKKITGRNLLPPSSTVLLGPVVLQALEVRQEQCWEGGGGSVSEPSRSKNGEG